MTTESSLQIDVNHWLFRLIALIIDSIIIAIPVYLIFFSLLFAGAWLIGYGSWLFFPFLLGLIEVLYFAILDVYWGATIGKKVLGLQVQMVNGDKVDFGKAFLRNISKIYPLFLFLDWLVGVVTPGADRRQKYTDRLAGTTVVQGKPSFAPVTNVTT